MFSEVCRQHISGGSEVISLASDKVSNTDIWIAVGVRTSSVLILKYDGVDKLEGVCTVKLRGVPMSVSFTGMRGTELYAFRLNNGNM